jgi:predicted ABC-type ATPase
MSKSQSNAIPRALIIAGPNGAGKTTFAREFLPAEAQCPTFINADLIAAGLSPFQPEAMALEASRLVLEHVRRCVARQESFAVETTLAGRVYLRYIQDWQAAGYRVKLSFLELPNVDMAIQRVRQRVAQGGHNVAEFLIRRRFQLGLANFRNLYRQVVDSWQLFDASQWPPVRIEEGAGS